MTTMTKTRTNGRGVNQTAVQQQWCGPDWCKDLLPGTWARLKTVWVGEVTLTPEVAAKFLAERNKQNRPMNRRQLRILRRAIFAGQFRINGDTIVFDSDGFVLNAQHRLTACVLAKKEIATLVVVGVPPDTFVTFDQHAKRSKAQILARNGEDFSTTLDPVMSRVAAFMEAGTFEQGKKGPQDKTIEDALRALDQYPGIRESVKFAVAVGREKAAMFQGMNVVGTLHWVFRQADEHLAEQFILQLCNSTIDPGSRHQPLRVLNDELKKNLDRKKKLGRGFTECYAVKAWNAFYNQQPLGKLNWKSDEPFPQVAGWMYQNGLPTGSAG